MSDEIEESPFFNYLNEVLGPHSTWDLVNNSSMVFVLLWYMAVGAAIGSFLNVVAYRLPLGMSLNDPPSRCPFCETKIGRFDNIPVFGWFLVRGRCRACREPIAWRYPFVEFLAALLFGLLFQFELMRGFENLVTYRSSALLGMTGLIIDSRYDLVFFHALHLVLISVVSASLLMAWDGTRTPRSLFVTAFVIAMTFAPCGVPPYPVTIASSQDGVTTTALTASPVLRATALWFAGLLIGGGLRFRSADRPAFAAGSLVFAAGCVALGKFASGFALYASALALAATAFTSITVPLRSGLRRAAWPVTAAAVGVFALLTNTRLDETSLWPLPVSDRLSAMTGFSGPIVREGLAEFVIAALLAAVARQISGRGAADPAGGDDVRDDVPQVEPADDAAADAVVGEDELQRRPGGESPGGEPLLDEHADPA